MISNDKIIIFTFSFLICLCCKYNADNPERRAVGIILTLLLGGVLLILPCLTKEATGIVKTFISAFVPVLISVLPAYMLLILKYTVKENIEILWRFFFLIAFVAGAMFTSDAISEAFSSMARGIGIWIPEYLVKIFVRRILNKHLIH